MRSWRELSDQHQSREARKIVRGRDRSWLHAESRGFIYHASSHARLAAVAEETEYAYGAVTERLGLAAGGRKAHIYIIESETTWTELIRRSDRREDGLAFHRDHEIFILRDRRRPSGYIDIPHEMVHFALWRKHGGRVPIWLDEGLAVAWGWDIARAYQETKSRQLYREQEPLDYEYVLPWDRLTALNTYPGSAEAVGTFYRQAAALTRAILDRIGPDRAGSFIQAMTRSRADWKQVVTAQFDCIDDDVAMIMKQADQELNRTNP